MVTREEVRRWWLDKNIQKDPRGSSPSLFHIYDYSSESWVFITSILNEKEI